MPKREHLNTGCNSDCELTSQRLRDAYWSDRYAPVVSTPARYSFK
ncbi:hypothetical protein [Nostoc foliaceum]|nr:hypothetical protein [Nostoc foliaceum]